MSDKKLITLTIKQAIDGLKSKQFSAQELVSAHLDRMTENRKLNAFITETPDLALEQAKITDKKIAKGEELGIMEGIPIAIKDLFCTKNIKTTAASRILENFIPQYESTVTENLRKSGAITLGKANLDEFAMGSANITSYFGKVENPWKSVAFPEKSYVPGGSSGGSAAAVAADLAMAATGTDTGGSIRQPVAFCGLVGLKPTYGLCSRWGVVAFASSLDQAGPITKTVEDSAIMLKAMAGYDAKDSTSINTKIDNYQDLLKGNVKGLKIGIPKELNLNDVDDDIAASWKNILGKLENAGAEITEISMPYMQNSLAVYYILAPAEASSNLARYDGVRFGYRAKNYNNLHELYCNTRGEGFGEEVKRRIMVGTYVLSAGYYDAYYLKAQKVRRLVCNDFINAYKKVDLIFTPTTPNTAFAIGEEPKDPIKMYMNDVLTVPANIAGLPSISVPSGLSKDGLPIGVQFIGPALSELSILNAGLFVENCANFRKK